MTALNDTRKITIQDLMTLGIQGLAYVRPVRTGVGEDGETVYVVFSADGSELAAYDNRELAFAAVRQNGLEPVSVH